MTIIDTMLKAARQIIRDEIALVESEIAKVKASQSQWSKQPVHKYHDALVAYWSKKLADALKDSLTGVKPAIAAAQKVRAKRLGKATAITASDDVASAALSHLAADPAKTRQILQWILQDSYGAGAQAAVQQIGSGATLAADMREADAAIDWDHWTPGDTQAADLVRGSGLQDLLDRAGAAIQDLQDTALQRVANAIADGLASGQSVDAIATSLGDAVSSNAETIANTEVARATVVASQDTYAANGIDQWSFLAEDDACLECIEDKDGSPYDVGDGPDIPVHPNCRCTPLPVVLDADGNNLAPTSDEGDQSSG